MTPSKVLMSIEALRREALDELRETSDEQLRREAEADNEDLDAVAEQVKAVLLAAVAGVSEERLDVGSEKRGGAVQVNMPESQLPAAVLRATAAGIRGSFQLMRAVRWGLAVTAALLGVTLVRMAPYNIGPVTANSETYATGFGQSRVVLLPDGSKATLNTGTLLTWSGTASGRSVQLESGEAVFEVVPDKDRPFRVGVSRSEIRVLGTEFDVYRRKDGSTRVTVIDGRVSVWSSPEKSVTPSWIRVLTRNQQLNYESGGEISRDVHSTDAREAVAWRDGSLEISDGTMRELVDELNRYSIQPIVLAPDSHLEQRRIVAFLTIRNVDEALATLQSTLPGLQVLRRDGAIVLSYHADETRSTRSSGAGRR